MRARFSWDRHVRVQVVADRLLAHQNAPPFRGDEDGDGVGACPDAEQGAVVAFDWNLAGQVVDPELGQSLPHASGSGAPLGLPELVHHNSPFWA